MKAKSLFMLTGLFLTIIFTGCSSSKSLTKEDKVSKEIALKEAIENREYHVNVDRIIPLSGRTRTLTSSYSLDVIKDNV